MARNLWSGITDTLRSHDEERIASYLDRVATALGTGRGFVARLIANRQAEIMMRIAAEFGFTPASRSRIATPSPAEPTLFDDLEEDVTERKEDEEPD